ncbi:MAG: nucleotide exchange factor GrpE [Planctomycetes bacterium]|nr:nucleotide exchange factor GrpE [Planctomycetota bacterium]
MSRRKKHKETPEENHEAVGENEVQVEAEGEKRIVTSEDIARIEKARDDYLDMARRARADYVNLQRRMETQFAAARYDARAKMALDMLAILDDVERALEHGRESDDYEGLMEGIALVREKFLAALARFDIKPIDSQGQPFDHNFHNAIAEQATDEAEPGTIVAVAQKGYTFGNRLLRPASVVVARPAEKPQEADDEI